MDFRSLKSKRSSRLSSQPAIAIASNSLPDRDVACDIHTTDSGPFEGKSSLGTTPPTPKNLSDDLDVENGRGGANVPQNHNWGTIYTSVPQTLEIRVTEETGRGLYSQTLLRPGPW